MTEQTLPTLRDVFDVYRGQGKELKCFDVGLQAALTTEEGGWLRQLDLLGAAFNESMGVERQERSITRAILHDLNANSMTARYDIDDKRMKARGFVQISLSRNKALFSCEFDRLLPPDTFAGCQIADMRPEDRQANEWGVDQACLFSDFAQNRTRFSFVVTDMTCGYLAPMNQVIRRIGLKLDYTEEKTGECIYRPIQKLKKMVLNKGAQ